MNYCLICYIYNTSPYKNCVAVPEAGVSHAPKPEASDSPSRFQRKRRSPRAVGEREYTRQK